MTETALKEKAVGGPLREFLRAYLDLGFSFFPVEWGQKAPPLVKWEEFQERRPSWEEVEGWLARYALFNVAVVCGRVSNLFAIDFDDEEAYESWKRSLPRDLLDAVRLACWIVKTGKGFHVYVRPEDPELIPRTKIRCRGGVDIKGEGGYVIAPPSLHPSGANYEGWNGLWPSLVPLKREVAERLLATLQPPLETAEEKTAGKKDEAPKPVPRVEELRELDGGKVEELARLLKPFYKPGYRHSIWLAFSGLCAKSGVHYVSAAKVLKKLYDETGDSDDVRVRGACITYTYAKAGCRVDKKLLAEVLGAEPHGPEEANLESVKGSSGLREAVERQAGAEEAERLVRSVRRLLAPPPLRIPVAWRVNLNGKEAVAWLVVRRLGDVCEVRLRRKARDGLLERPFAVLPEIALLRDTATGNAFFVAREEGRIVAISTDLEGLLRQLVALGYVSKTTLGDINLQLLLRAVMRREEGELAPGLGADGFVDPLGVGLDAGDYGVESLLAARDWISKHYPESNRKAALANVALAVAKLLSPVLRKLNPTFVDNVVWNYGRGGEGKTTLLVYIVLPLLSVQPDSEKAYALIRGAVETSPQMAFLVTINRLPLILDEQTLKALERNADILLSAVVGQGIIKIHAPRYGLLGEVRFKNLRGLIVATNVEFSRWLRRVREHASDIAYTRRVIAIEWENESLKPEGFGDVPALKPVLGAVEKVWKLKREELVKCKDVVELAERLFALLGEAYGADLSAYVEAVKEVREKWEGASGGVKATDVDIVRERAYEIARQQLGATGLTGAKVLLSIIENPDVYGVKLLRPRESSVLAREREELEALAQRLSQYEGAKQLADALYHLAAGDAARVVLKANGPLVPGAPRSFLGAGVGVYKFGDKYANGYALPLARFARIFLETVEEEPVSTEAEDREKEQ